MMVKEDEVYIRKAQAQSDSLPQEGREGFRKATNKNGKNYPI